MEKLIEKNYFLHKSSQEAYKGYVRSYASHSLKQIFDVTTLDLQKVALSFGFKVPPYVDLNVQVKKLGKGDKSSGATRPTGGVHRNSRSASGGGFSRRPGQVQKSKHFRQVNKIKSGKIQYSR